MCVMPKENLVGMVLGKENGVGNMATMALRKENEGGIGSNNIWKAENQIGKW